MNREYIVFPRRRGNESIVFVSRVSEAERRDHPWVGVVVLKFDPALNGFPDKSAKARLESIEDQLVNALGSAGAIHVGHVIIPGFQRVMFYSGSQGPSSSNVKVGFMKKESVSIEWRHDPDWTVYDEELRPTIEEEVEARYRPLMRTLAQHGDDHAIERPVDFAARFPTESGRDGFVEEMAAAGFVLGDAGVWEPAPGDFWCELTRSTPVEPSKIVPICISIIDAAERHGGSFDGWACPVATG